MGDVPPPIDRTPAPGGSTPGGGRGVPRYGWFGGVVEGRVGDPDAMRGVAEQITALGVVACDLEIEGGRFSLLFDDASVPGERLTLDAQNALVDGLQAILRSAAPGTVESTLRGALVYPTSVVETLFAVKDDQFVPVSRRRDLDEHDRAHAPDAGGERSASGDALARLGTKRGLALLALIVLASGLFAWNRGYFGLLRDTLFSPDASELAQSTGAFGDALELSVEERFAMYVCTVRRGPAYPGDAEAADRLIDAAVTAEERAAAMAITGGGEIGVVLFDKNRNRLEVAPVALAPLLTDEGASVEVEVRSRLRGQRVELSVDTRPAEPGDGASD
ncbi:MAG: hypothetical protein AAF726_00075 [Planctomycetota bacterium]